MDVHSGLGGSIFPNAAWRLVWALSTLKDQNEHIRLPGHYDTVKPPSERDRQLMDACLKLLRSIRRATELTTSCMI
jgi:hypothetical protein